MRRGRGGGTAFLCVVALSATAGCVATVRRSPEPDVSETSCSLVGTPRPTADSASLRFDAVGITREVCSLTLAAEALRPWPTSPPGRWTVLLTITPEAVTARRLDSEQARDAIDAGRALLVTEDLDLVAYASARDDLEVTHLPWDRTYLGLSPDSALWLGTVVGADAVRVDARDAGPPLCDALPIGTPGNAASPRSGRVLYSAGDPTARELAERIVALTGKREVTAAGVGVEELDASLHTGDALAYIASVPRASQCYALAGLVQRAPWITSGAIHPLIDTRAHAIVPRGSRP
jgi:hypothetical protein